MKMKRLEKSVLKLWYIRAVIASLALIGIAGGVIAVLVFIVLGDRNNAVGEGRIIKAG